MELADFLNMAKYNDPLPTLYNPQTKQFEEVHPSEARQKGVPIGPPRYDPGMVDRMWRDQPHMGYMFLSPVDYVPSGGTMT